MDLTQIRADFPLLKKSIKGKPIVYFDNACMSLKPQPVIEAITRYYTEMSACAGRSNHRLATAVNEAVENTRNQVKQLINASRPEEIIFTRNTTEGLNLLAQSLNLKAGDTILTTGKEHNSNLVPWLKLQKTKGITHKIIPLTPDNQLDLDAYDQLLAEGAAVVAVGQTSNLDGVTLPIKDIIAKAHRAGAITIIDAAQSAPHQKIDVRDLDTDFLCFSGHKMLGPTGTGILYGKYKLLDKLDGFLVGGDTVEYTTYTDYQHLPLPEKFEAGLQDYAGIIGLGAAVEYLNKLDRPALLTQEIELNRIVTEGLGQNDRVHIIGPKEPNSRGGIVSFYVDEADPHQISLLLDETYGIMVRSGQHCVHSWFNAKGIKGSVRASFYLYNTPEEAERLVTAMNNILQVV